MRHALQLFADCAIQERVVMPMNVGPDRGVTIQVPPAETVFEPCTAPGGQEKRLVLRRNPICHLREGVPDVDQQIARGEFSGLMGWLKQNVHGQGARVSAQDLLKLSTGKPLSAAAALRYLETKYLEPETVVGSAAA